MWKCPLIFQRDFVCTWNGGYDAAQPTAHDKKSPHKEPLVEVPQSNDYSCRCIFDNISSYHQHLRTAHTWFCPACDTKNTAASYPVCVLCGNHRHAVNGADMLHQFQLDVSRVQNKLYQFLTLERAHETDDYNIKDRYNWVYLFMII